MNSKTVIGYVQRVTPKILLTLAAPIVAFHVLYALSILIGMVSLIFLPLVIMGMMAAAILDAFVINAIFVLTLGFYPYILSIFIVIVIPIVFFEFKKNPQTLYKTLELLTPILLGIAALIIILFISERTYDLESSFRQLIRALTK